MSILFRFFSLVVVLDAFIESVQAGAPSYGGNPLFHGKGTYYGTPPMAPNTHVHCHLPNNMFGLTTIAINADQYDNSKACGMCVRVYGSGKVCEHGIDPGDNSCGLGANPITGVFDAVITDELQERGYGDIDLGKHGDGHWGVSWHPIPCPWHNPKIVLHAGCNKNFAKVQGRYLDSPMEWVEINGQRSHNRFHDNFFVFQADGNGFNFDQNGKIFVKFQSTLGTTYCGQVDQNMQPEDYEYPAWVC